MFSFSLEHSQGQDPGVQCLVELLQQEEEVAGESYNCSGSIR